MRVALVANTSWYLYNFRRHLILRLKDSGYEVVCIAPEDPYSIRLQEMGAAFLPWNVSRRGTNPLFELAMLWTLFSLMRKAKSEIVLSFTPKANIYAGICRWLIHFQYMPNISGMGEAWDRKGTLYQLVSFLYRATLLKSCVTLFQNGEDYEFFVKTKGYVSREKALRIPGSGVDLDRFTPVKPDPNKRNGKLILLIFGRLIPQKGFGMFMDVAQSLEKENIANFWVLGIPDPSRVESRMLQERAEYLHRRGTIRYLGSTDDVLPIIRNCDAVVLPSLYNEGIPKSLLEALACGKVIITSDWRGCRETVDHRVNGYLVKGDDCNGLRECIVHLSTLPKEKLQEMGNASRAKAEKEFDENFVLDLYIKEVGKIQNLPN